ncbi:lytic transglycosylase domain-containing protein [Shumkonia mesophila]|uniref:lytic transglycosylase domain-containing protein n=1 Tax=Shumkonia mesophila TaxID=2838854 RepID=UPI00293416C8|nr:lytic transglycosylase domain-containing protein [Shumkonia mesophila]
MRPLLSTARCPTAPTPRPGLRAFRLAAFLGAVVIAVAAGLAAASAAPLSDSDFKAARAAFAAIEKNQWKTAHQHAAAAGDPLVAKIVRWFDYTRPETDADFASIVAFLESEAQWPSRADLRRRAEEKLPGAMSHKDVLAWFERYPPVSTDGLIRHATALMAIGRDEGAHAAVRKAWIEGDFGKSQEQNFFRRFRGLLTPADHRARLERLLWEDRQWSAQHMLFRVDADARALAEARLALMAGKGGIDRLLDRVPAKLKNDPGLTYERLRWRRKKGRYEAARELLKGLPPDPLYPRKWWIERDILARRALDDGSITDAYRIAKEHGLKPTEANAREYADAEWMAGWIALRLLGDHAVALDHFVAMYQVVQYPISRARGAYWAGRAAEAMGMLRVANLWYAAAAHLPTTFYGQLALAKLAPESPLKFPADPQPTAEEAAAFKKHELARAIEILGQVGETVRLRPFLLTLAAVSDQPGWRALTADLAHIAGRPDLGVLTAKNADRNGQTLLKAGYPTVELPVAAGSNGRRVEPALALAVIRQESAFWPEAISSAGARGLMQLMPATAKHVAKIVDVAYANERLTGDPPYNLKLGTAYLAQMVDDFGGSYVLALAAYNAGPSRARQWIRELGNPGQSWADTVDWIESIPFGETRNYIQRVLENLQVYRGRLTNTPLPLGLELDLARSSGRQAG